MSNGHLIYFTKLEDGSFLAASIDHPRFCVGAPTEIDAKAKAQRALDYFKEEKGESDLPAPRSTTVISPIFERELLCA